ncbi:uncharacterized protein Tco025E_08728 [Trypanosoma conorhini]|uniref:Uncharacterized protein n=1 Tax=Trypanosoma conorhini TaxID=83891 RepID=A0A422N5V6_9TRYP|nr:uncharacterized protein Tco025E_08728 [Trypanosoma conorhini]RNF00864.1 hypothetical protein Tco025E_08728 [Trypanosoma conorhini]
MRKSSKGSVQELSTRLTGHLKRAAQRKTGEAGAEETEGKAAKPLQVEAQRGAGGGGVGGATGQTIAAKGREQEGDGAERPATTEHGSATGKAVANSADGTATNALFVRAPLLLLLLAACLACAVRQW